MICDASLCGDTYNESRKFLETKRDIPQINGSSKAFIIIVVFLVFIIIAAWAAILFLLCNQRAFDIEHAHRSKGEQPPTPLHLSNAATWRSRITTFFGSVGQKIENRIQKWRAMKGGWVRAENWETDTGGPSGIGVGSTGPSSLQNNNISHSLSTLSRSTSGSLSSVHVDVHGTRDLSYPQVMSNFPCIESQLFESSPLTSPQSSNIHLSTLSSESIPDYVRFDADSREYVGSSGVLMRTLRGGTKFVEGL